MERLLQNLALGKRLGLVVGILAMLALAAAAGGLWGMSQAKESLHTVHQDSMIPAIQLSEIERLVTENRRLLAEGDLALVSGDEGVQKVAADNAKQIEANRAEVEKLWKDYSGSALGEKEKKLAAAFEQAMAAHSGQAEKPALEALRALDAAKLRGIMQSAEATTASAERAALLPLIGLQADAGQEEYDAAVARYRNAWIVICAALAAGLALALWIAHVTVRGITRPLESAIAGIQGMAKGDLTFNFKRGGKDEMAWMYYELHLMQKGLRKLVSAVSEDARQVSAAASQLNGAAGQIGDASRHQSEAVSSTAAAVEEMTVSINHIAAHAGEAARVAKEAHELAHGGERVVRDASGQVSAIEKAVAESGELIEKLRGRSEEIGRIVQAIQGIAEQTNLLALNAAIEAARAGEQGRGFAVVADEVRQLAGHTSQATAEIERMIASIQSETRQAVEVMHRGSSQVKEGVRLADAAAQSLEQISEGSQRTAGTVNEIATATGEQRAASTEIARNVERIAQMAEENTAAVQETAAAAHRLEELAVRLNEQVASFKLA